MEGHHQQQLQQQRGVNGGVIVNGRPLEPGFRFHPKDEELITYYLWSKVIDPNFTTEAVVEADLNKTEPWDLPSLAIIKEENVTEWFFYCRKDRKYPTGHRANRATEAGYWKATGKDRQIYYAAPGRPLALVGTKKTLVFYTGRAPRGIKTDWVMHEYKHVQNDVWVVCRVFNKSSGKNPELPPPAPAPAPAPAPVPAYNMNMGMGMGMDSSVDLRSINFPAMPTKFPMEPDYFTMDSSSPSFYSTGDGVGSSSSVLPPLPPALGMGSTGYQTMNTNYFGGTTQQLPPFYQQQVGTIGMPNNFNFVAEPDSNRPTSMLSHDPKFSPGQAGAAEISSVAAARQAIAAEKVKREVAKALYLG